jgi:hypothetical protein
MRAPDMKKRFSELLLLTIVLFFCVQISFAQPVLPQRSLTVTATQSIHFGTLFVTGAGGTVTVGWDGSRTSSGSLTLLSMAPTSHPAIFEIKLCEGRNVSITFDPTINLTGSNGGSLTLDLGPTEKGPIGATFATNSDCNFITPLRMGGTLHVPGTAIPGTYTGSFAITFNQQ